MGVSYLWDTNTVIYYLQQQFPQPVEKYVDELVIDNPPAISVITEIELLCWKTENHNDLKVLHSFINDTLIIELDTQVKLTTADIRKTYKIKLPDAIIAATAIVHDLTLVTRNTADFKGLNNIKLINPWTVTSLTR